MPTSLRVQTPILSAKLQKHLQTYLKFLFFTEILKQIIQIVYYMVLKTIFVFSEYFNSHAIILKLWCILSFTNNTVLSDLFQRQEVKQVNWKANSYISRIQFCWVWQFFQLTECYEMEHDFAWKHSDYKPQQEWSFLVSSLCQIRIFVGWMMLLPSLTLLDTLASSPILTEITGLFLFVPKIGSLESYLSHLLQSRKEI